MRPIAKSRVLIVFPVLFAIVGGWLIDVSIAFRAYFAPAPGIGIGIIVLATAGIAAQRLWVASRRASLFVFLAGTVAIAAVVAAPYLFPIVEAAGDPSDFRLARMFYTALSVVAGLTIVSVWLTSRVRQSIGRTDEF